MKILYKNPNVKNKSGHPPVVTPEVVSLLNKAFTNGANDKLACQYAGISHDAFYNFLSYNPEYADYRSRLKITPQITALGTVVGDLDNVTTAKWLLEKTNEDFKEKQKEQNLFLGFSLMEALNAIESRETKTDNTIEGEEMIEEEETE